MCFGYWAPDLQEEVAYAKGPKGHIGSWFLGSWCLYGLWGSYVHQGLLGLAGLCQGNSLS